MYDVIIWYIFPNYKKALLLIRFLQVQGKWGYLCFFLSLYCSKKNVAFGWYMSFLTSLKSSKFYCLEVWFLAPGSMNHVELLWWPPSGVSASVHRQHLLLNTSPFKLTDQFRQNFTAIFLENCKWTSHEIQIAAKYYAVKNAVLTYARVALTWCVGQIKHNDRTTGHLMVNKRT